MGCYLFSGLIKEFLPLQCCDYWALPHQLVWIWALPHQLVCILVWIWALPHHLVEYRFEYGLYPIIWLNMGLNMGLTPLVVWIWALPHQLVWIWVLPHQWYILLGFTPSIVCLKGFIPICGLVEGLYPHPWFVWRDLSRQCFDSSPGMLPPIKNVECLYCDVGLLPFWTCPILFQRSYHYTILWVSYMFTHSRIHSMHTDIIRACLHCQSCFNYTESVIRNVIQKCYQSSISQVAGPRGSLLLVYSRFPSIFRSLVIIPVKVIDGIFFFFVCWSLPQ